MSDKPILVDGIKIDITLDDIDDIEVAEMLEEGKIAAVLRHVFGQEKYEAIKDHFKKKNGKARISDLNEWFNKVAERLGAEAKN